jgi:hypothetical protein
MFCWHFDPLFSFSFHYEGMRHKFNFFTLERSSALSRPGAALRKLYLDAVLESEGNVREDAARTGGSKSYYREKFVDELIRTKSLGFAGMSALSPEFSVVFEQRMGVWKKKIEERLEKVVGMDMLSEEVQRRVKLLNFTGQLVR